MLYKIQKMPNDIAYIGIREMKSKRWVVVVNVPGFIYDKVYDYEGNVSHVKEKSSQVSWYMGYHDTLSEAEQQFNELLPKKLVHFEKVKK